MGKHYVIHDPLYGPIHLDEAARAIINTIEYQRLRRIKQLSTVNAVYPGANHTRFEHAVGVYHLSRTVLHMLADRNELSGLGEQDVRLIQIANCLHDIAHHGGSAHALEAAGIPGACHESAAERFCTTGELGSVLRSIGGDGFGLRVARLIRNGSDHPLQGLVSGACDPDKMDYLRRDPYHCGLVVGYDQNWLRTGLTLLEEPDTGTPTIGIDAEVLPAFEAMLYTKQMMYRNVYYHPKVISAATMLRTIVVTALTVELVTMDEVQDWTDEEVIMAVRARVGSGADSPEARLVSELVKRFTARDLYDEVASLPVTRAPEVPHGSLVDVERELAELMGVGPGKVIMDYPHKPDLLSTNILVRMPDDSIRRADSLAPEDGFAMNALRAPLMAATSRVRIFSADTGQLQVRNPDDIRDALVLAIERAAR